MNIKVFVGNNHKILYCGKGLEKPTLTGYVYEYETYDANIKFWNSLRIQDQEKLVDEAEKRKIDIRLLIEEKRFIKKI